MRILEVRDGFIKFEVAKDVSESSFIKIEDSEKSYIAQVIQTKFAGENNIVYAKILFLNYEGVFGEYDKTLPSRDAVVEEFDFKEINKTFGYKEPIIAGKFIANNEDILLDRNSLKTKTLLSFDSHESNRIVVNNLAKQFKHSVIIDTLGIFESSKYIAGKDFKLPLNTDSLRFMYEDCLNDATSDSKDLIKEIFKDLAEYSKTVSFLPFKTLKTIVDDMVNKSHIFKLLVLKNKLAKFDTLGYFASSKEEADNLSKILTSQNTVIDLSKLDPIFQNRYIEIILDTLEKHNLKPQIFVEASNNINKSILKRLIANNLECIFVTHSRFKYLSDIKPMFENYIIEPTFSNNEIFKQYSTFLNTMKKNFYLLVGESTSYIPLISKIEELYFEESKEQTINDNEILIELEASKEDSDNDTNKENSSNTVVDSSIAEIEKKSEILIEQVSSEIQAENIDNNFSLFNEEDETEIETIEQTQEESSFSENLEESLTEEDLSDDNEEELIESDDEEDSSFKNQTANDFHTQVETIQAIDIPSDISELEDIEEFGEEIEDKVVEVEELVDENEEIIEIGNDEALGIEPQEPNHINETFIDNDMISELDETEPEGFIEQEENVANETQNLVSEEFESIEEIVELDPMELSDEDIIVEVDISEELSEEEQREKDIIEDVDKVFTTIKEDSISDSDLDFIDELNSEDEEINLSEGMEELVDFAEEEPEEDLLEPIEEVQDFSQANQEKDVLERKSPSTPTVPVYGAEIPEEDLVISDPIEQGDTVVHAKYGTGIVEKMIKYGTKNLYSINFDNVGRRLLDPTLTEIKKA